MEKPGFKNAYLAIEIFMLAKNEYLFSEAYRYGQTLCSLESPVT